MNKIKFFYYLVFILIISSSCSLSLLPSTSGVSYFDLDFSRNLHLLDNLCMEKEAGKNQILVSNIKTERPYDGYSVYQLEQEGNILPLKTVEWISPLSSLYPAKIESLLLESCSLPNTTPIFTTDIISKSKYIADVTLIFARITSTPDGQISEAKISATLREERSGNLLVIKSNTVAIKSGPNPSQKQLILNLQKAIFSASLQTLRELN